MRGDDRPIAGTQLIPEYQDVEHVVTVTRDGYEYQGQPYQLLSAIARHITGTRWNGRVFFGLTKSDVYRMLSNRVYLGEAVHKGTPYPSEHAAIVTQAAWDAAHAVLQVNPRVRINRTRNATVPLLRGLVFESDGRAMSPSYSRGRGGRMYRYYVSQAVLQGGGTERPEIARLPAGEIEAAVVAQVRALLHQPEMVVGTWRVPLAADAGGGTLRDAHRARGGGKIQPLLPLPHPAADAARAGHRRGHPRRAAAGGDDAAGADEAVSA
jgi:hypothetical protein